MWTLKRGINPIMKLLKIWTVEWYKENFSRFESWNGITKENPNIGKTGKEKVRNWKNKLRGKTTNMIQGTEDRILSIVDKTEELCNSLRESVISKDFKYKIFRMQPYESLHLYVFPMPFLLYVYSNSSLFGYDLSYLILLTFSYLIVA